VKNYKAKEILSEEKEKVQKFEIMLLLRKGNSLIHLGKKLEAVKQYELALEITPDDERIKADLDKIRN
jgi:predicted negative regulator of RcsB-dependent stress response